MSPSGLELDPDRVRAVADEIARTGEGLRTARTSRGPDLGPAAGQTAGWAAADAARVATAAWTTFVDRLATSADGLAARLRSATAAYEASDARAEASLRKQYAK